MASLKDKVGALGQFMSGSTNRYRTSDLGPAPAGVDPEQWAANPYSEFDYRKSGWQKILEGFGFRTNFDAYSESMALQAREYAASLADKAHNEQYDSAAAQAARERSAGLNPDLAGNVDAGSSSPLADDGNPPVAPSSDFDSFAQFGSIFLEGLNMASALAGQGFNIASIVEDIRGKKISNDVGLLDEAFKGMLALTSPEDMDNFMNSDMSVQAVNYEKGLSELFGKRRAKKLVSAVNRVATGLTGHDMEMAMRNNFVGNWTSYHDQTNNSGFSMFNDTMKVIRHELSEQFWKNLNDQSKLDNMKIQDETLYEDQRINGDGSDASTIAGAQAVNEGRLLGYESFNSYQDWMNKQQQYTMQQSAASVVKKLNELADNGNWFAGLAALAIQFLFTRFSAGVGLSHRF